MFALHNACSYVSAAACPCMVMNNIGRTLVDLPGHNEGHSCAALCISVLTDLPCVFGVKSAQERLVDMYWNNNEHEDEEEEGDEWKNSESFDWWPIHWCGFYTLGACECCCSDLCIGPNVQSHRFPLLFSCMAAAVYPLCICPLACLMRRMTIDKQEIETEGLLSTCAKTVFCTPCSLVQIEKELDMNSALVNVMAPYTQNFIS